MQITRATDYAVRAVLYLAAYGGDGLLPAARIARDQGIPPAYVTKVLQALQRAGLVTSYQGRSGGAALARPANEVSVLDVVRAVEGPVSLNRCTERKGECPRDSICPVHDLWASLEKDMADRLGGADFATLAKKLRRKTAHARRRKKA